MVQLAERAGQALENARLYALATEARERFAAAFDHAPIGIALINGEGVIEEANPECTRSRAGTRSSGIRSPSSTTRARGAR